MPAVRAFIRIFAPRRGEIVVDAEALDLRPPKERRPTPTDRGRHAGRRANAGRPETHGGRRSPTLPSRPGGEPESPEPGAMTLEIDVLTLFPAMIEGPLPQSIPGRIQEQGLATVRVHDLREWGLGATSRSTTRPYGGAPGW